jgi:hypothetical protein
LDDPALAAWCREVVKRFSKQLSNKGETKGENQAGLQAHGDTAFMRHRQLAALIPDAEFRALAPVLQALEYGNDPALAQELLPALEAVAKHPASRARLTFARARNALRMGDIATAERLLAVVPKGIEPVEMRADFGYLQARIVLTRNEIGHAIEQVRAALADDPDYVDARFLDIELSVRSLGASRTGDTIGRLGAELFDGLVQSLSKLDELAVDRTYFAYLARRLVAQGCRHAGCILAEAFVWQLAGVETAAQTQIEVLFDICPTASIRCPTWVVGRTEILRNALKPLRDP